jgi:hypothetical protein
MPFDLSLIANIPGWLTTREANLLYALATKCTGKGVILEIGSWKGRSTVCLARGSLDGASVPVFAVDPFTGSSEHGDVYTYPEFKRNIEAAGVAKVVTAIQKPSGEAAKGWSKPIELLWIDGAHEEEFVRIDFDAWAPHLIEGGVIAFHDSTDPGPWKVIHEKLFFGKDFHSIRFVHGITWAVKGKATPIRNFVMMALCNLKYRLWTIKKTLRKRGIVVA